MHFKYFIIIGFILCVTARVNAQTDTVVATNDSAKKQLDLIDVADKLFKLHLSRKTDSSKIKPGKVLIAFAPAVGYTLDQSYLASIAVNGSFYTSDPKTTNLSVVTAGAQYSVRNQLELNLISNIWTEGNKFDLMGDYRFYKYPSNTYGLGDNTSINNYDLIDYSYVRIYQEALRHFSSYYYFGAGYNYDYHFNIKDNGDETDFQQYNNYATKTVSSGAVIHFMYDNRTNINNPKKAFYFSVQYRINSTLLGSDQNWEDLQVEMRKYFKLSPTMVLALWSWNQFTFGGQAPYFDLPSNGWDTYANTGRGYVQGRFRGPDMLYDEAEYRFGITRNGFLGGVLFVNAESVSNWPQNQFTSIYPGEGFGLRVKFNKFSDVNICIDYAFGEQGSNGLFFNLGEVF